MKTVTDVNTVNQLLTYSKQAEAGIHQKAIQMLLGAGNNKKQDSLSISDAARGFSKQSIKGFGKREISNWCIGWNCLFPIMAYPS